MMSTFCVCLQWSGAEVVQLVIRHIKQGLDGLGKEILSQTLDAPSTDNSSHQTCPPSVNSQVIVHSAVYFYWLLCDTL